MRWPLALVLAGLTLLPALPEPVLGAAQAEAQRGQADAPRHAEPDWGRALAAGALGLAVVAGGLLGVRYARRPA